MHDPESHEHEAPASVGARKLGRRVGGLIGGAVDLAVGTVVGFGQAGKKILLTPMRLPGLGRPEAVETRAKPGGRPGIEHAANVDRMPDPAAVRITVIDYNPDRVEQREVPVGELVDFLNTPRPEWVRTRWINIDGLHAWVVNQVRKAFNYHTLAAEDTLHAPQRPKVEPYDGYLFVVARMLEMRDERLMAEQTSYYLSTGLLVSFQEKPGDIWAPIRERINTPGTRLRQHGAGYLFYALMDAVIDHCFPILEAYGNLLEDLEFDALNDPAPEVLNRIHGVKRQLVTLRRIMWPLREAVDFIARSEESKFTDFTRNYLRDVYDHTVQVIDIIETYREMAGGLTDLYMSAVSNRMNEVMKVLTIMSALFIPITFIAGVFGMNFAHMPELSSKWLYPYGFWGLTVACVGGMLYYFRLKRWIG